MNSAFLSELMASLSESSLYELGVLVLARRLFPRNKNLREESRPPERLKREIVCAELPGPTGPERPASSGSGLPAPPTHPERWRATTNHGMLEADAWQRVAVVRLHEEQPTSAPRRKVATKSLERTEVGAAHHEGADPESEPRIYQDAVGPLHLSACPRRQQRAGPKTNFSSIDDTSHREISDDA